MPLRAPLLTCPHCFATLALRDRRQLRKRAACPACGGAILLSPDPTHTVVGQIPPESASAAVTHGILEPTDAGPQPEGAPRGSTVSPSAESSDRAAQPAGERTAQTASKEAASNSAPPRTPGQPTRRKRRRAATSAGGTEPPPALKLEAAGARPALVERIRSPAGIGWLVGGMFAAILLLVAAPWRDEDFDAPSAPVAMVAANGGTSVQDDAVLDANRGAASERGLEQASEAIDPPPPAENAGPIANGSDADGHEEGDPGKAEAAPDAASPSRGSRPVSRDEGEAALAELPEASEAGPAVDAAPVKPARPPIDVAARLRQRIARFDQTRAAPLKDLLLVIEDMAGIPVRLDEADSRPSAVLEQTHTLSLENTTVEELLQSLADRAELVWEIRGEEIRLRKK